MKIQVNMTDYREDLARFASREDLEGFLEGFDGLELLHGQEDERGILPPGRIVGLHMNNRQYWLDFWKGDLDRCARELGGMENVAPFYGGGDRQALVEMFRQDLEAAQRFGAEYMVYHVSDSSIFETMLQQYSHSDEEVVDAACELINQVLPADYDGPWLLLENLWEAGFTFTRPEITRRMLEGVRYKKTGIMLDTGHLMHCNPALKNQDEAVEYIHRCLDLHGPELCSRIRGIHLQQSITGKYTEKFKKNCREPEGDLTQRYCQLFNYVFMADRHKPFTAKGVGDLIRRIDPRYVTFEFISQNRQEHQRMLDYQKKALGYDRWKK